MSGVALVTGASRGIGRAIALELASDGFDVAVGYHSRRAEAKTVADEIEAIGRRAIVVAMDVTDVDSCHEMVTWGRELGPIRAVVSNATGFSGGPQGDLGLASALETSLSTMSTMMMARVVPLVSLVDAAAEDLADGGRVVALTSTGTRQALHGYAAVAAGMAASEVLVRYLAVELGPRGVTVNAVSGGLVDTDALADISHHPEKLKAAVARSTPLGRVGTPEDIARVVAFLCGARGGWVTGQTLVADGGNLLR